MGLEQVTGGVATAVDFERYRLRAFVDRLGPQELERRAGTTRLSEIARALEANSKAVLFEHAGGHPLVGNVLASRTRLAQAFGVSPQQLLPEILRRLRLKPEFIEVGRGEAPVQQVVLTGADVDLSKLPVHLQHGKDGGPFISAAMDFARDPATGWTNVGLRRLMLRGRASTGIDLVAPSDLRTIYLATLARGERLPLSVVVGGHPIDYFGATMRLPVDELGLLASLRAAPMPVVKSITNDIRIPADAEWVLEGYLGEEGYREPEGPYGEFLGYYGGVKTNPVFHVTAVTRRRDALFQTLTIGGATMSRTDTAQLACLRTEVLIWRALETAVREPVAVYAPAATGGTMNVRIALRQRVPGEARNAIMAAFGSQANVKNVFVVDPDIDIFSRRADGMGAGHALPAAPRSRGRKRFSHAAARSVTGRDYHRRQGRLRSHVAVRPPARAGIRDPAAAALRRPQIRIGRGGATGRPEILRESHGRARQRRRTRDRARAGRAASTRPAPARSSGGTL